MMQEAEKTIVAKVRTDKARGTQLRVQRVSSLIQGDDDADLYSATKQAADAYIDTENTSMSTRGS